MLRTAQKETGAGVIMITHDLGVVAGTADRVAVMYAGRIVETGDVDDIFYRSRMPYTIGLLGSLPRLDARKDSALATLEGNPPSLLELPRGCPFIPRCPMAQELVLKPNRNGLTLMKLSKSRVRSYPSNDTSFW